MRTMKNHDKLYVTAGLAFGLAGIGAVHLGMEAQKDVAAYNHHITRDKLAPRVSDATEERLEQAFKDGKDFWKKKVGGVATTRLKILSGNETFKCGTSVYRGNQSPSTYCAKNGGTVVLTALSIEPFKIDGKEYSRSVEDYYLGHELGHAWAFNKPGEYKGLDKSAHNVEIAGERIADCAAGVLIQKTLGMDRVNEIKEILHYMPPSDDHPSAEQMVQDFSNGAQHGHCPDVRDLVS